MDNNANNDKKSDKETVPVLPEETASGKKKYTRKFTWTPARKAAFEKCIAARKTGAKTESKPESKPEPKPEPKTEKEKKKTNIIKKPKKKIKKKIIFESESDHEEAVVVHKKKPPKPLENLVYQSNKDQLYQRMVEERIRHAMIGYGNSLGV